MSATRRLRVEVAEPYDVVVGAGVLAGAARALGARRHVAIVTQDAVPDALLGALRAALAESAGAVSVHVIGGGEAAKAPSTVEALCSAWARAGVLRGDAVVALGGGVVGDTAGFAAAVYHRGVDVLQVPTTLLAQVDAAIGGKTAVNLPEGKNLLGAFHQPVGVLADVDALASLPAREYRSGLGEVAKYALAGAVRGADGAELGATGECAAAVYVLLRRAGAAVASRDPEVLTELVAHCAAVKAAVVAADERERTGVRAALNYGHTLAHALETAGGYDLAHGEAVAVGLVFAAALAAALERVPAGAVEAHRELLAGLGLPVAAPDAAGAPELLALMRRDKKARGGLTFVLLGRDGLGTVDDPPAAALEHAFDAVGVRG